MSKWNFIRENMKCLGGYRTRHFYSLDVTVYTRDLTRFAYPALTDSIRDWGFIMRPFNDLPQR